MSTSKLDAVYRSILFSTKFFTKGWGKPENLRRLFEFRKIVSNREECFKLIEKDYPVTITKEETLTDCRVLEGHFITPMERYLPGIVPEIAQKAHFQVILPIHWPDSNCKPVCLHLAGTGDHYFWRRRNLMVKPLLKETGIGGIILENPFYGLRKPTDQIRSCLHNVSDIFVMGGCLILESLVMFHWCERNGLGPLGVTGLSMGGHMASLAATNWPKPLVLVPCLSWSTASAVFLQGVMRDSINWDLLEDQYLSDGIYREKLSKMVTIVDEAFLAGKKFAQTYSLNMVKDEVTSKMKPIVGHNDTAVKNLDVTLKKLINAKINAQEVIDITKNVVLNEKVPKDVPESDVDNVKEELKILLDENKISVTLFNKLMSNEKFELEPQDIEDINKHNEDKIKEILLKSKVADYQKAPTNSQNETAKIETVVKNVEPQIIEPFKKEEDKVTLKSTETITVSNTKEKDAKSDSYSNKSDTNSNKSDTNSKSEKSWNVTSDWLKLSFLKSTEKKIDIGKINWRDREALQFMRGIMDECTHLSNFSVPFDTSLIIAVCAKHDAYVPRDDVATLEEIWPGAEVRYVDAGHVAAYILHQSLFRSCIREAFERSKKKWKDGKHIL